MEKKILIVDDEKVALRPYQQELELAGYSVEIISDSSKCKALIEDPLSIKTDMFIIDIMMPSKRIYDDSKTESGLLTGLHLATDIRKINQHTPILLWSAGIFPEIVRQTKALAKRLDDCAFIRKGDYLPYQLVEFINSYFDKGSFTTGFLKTLWDKIIIEPKLYGIGVEIKKSKR